jgi:hypothetical protein
VDLDVRSLGATSLLEDLLAGGDDDDDYDLRVRSLDSAVCLISIYPIILVLVVTGGVSLFPFFFLGGGVYANIRSEGHPSLFTYRRAITVRQRSATATFRTSTGNSQQEHQHLQAQPPPQRPRPNRHGPLRIHTHVYTFFCVRTY